MKILKSLRILLCIFLLLNIFILGCGKKKASEPVIDVPSITVEEDAKLTKILGQTIDIDSLGYSPTSVSIPASIFTLIKNKIDARGDFLYNCYICSAGTCYAKNAYTSPAQTAIMKTQLVGIMSEIGFSGLFSQVFLGAYTYYVNREGTLTFNSDNTMSYSSISAHTIFKSENFPGLLKEDAMLPQSAAGTYSLVENSLSDISGTPTGEKENMLNWIGNTDTDQAILPNRSFKVLIISDKNILMTYPFVKDGATPKPLSISIASSGVPADLAASKLKLIGKWNYLNVGSIEFADDGSNKTWNYSTGGVVADSGTWDVIQVGSIYYLKLLYLQTRVYNEQTGGSELKAYTNPRWVIIEYYVDDNYFGMNIYRSSSNTLVGSWTHNNYDYMDNYWAYNFYPASLTETELLGYKDQINAKNADDKALFEKGYNEGDPRVKKAVKGGTRTLYKPSIPKKLPLFDKMNP